jgi:hypothetical protein
MKIYYTSPKIMDNIQQMLEHLLALQEQTIAKMGANHKEMMAKICAGTDANRAETKDIHERRMAKLDALQERTLAHQEVTETEPNPGMMQSAEEHQEIPNEDAAVMPVG